MKRLKLLTKYFLKNALAETFGKTKINPWLMVLGMVACYWITINALCIYCRRHYMNLLQLWDKKDIL